MTGPMGDPGEWWSSSRSRRFVSAFGVDQAATAAFYVLLPWVAAHELSRDGAISVIALASVAKLAMLILAGGALGDRYGFVQVTRVTLAARIVILVGLSAVLVNPTYSLLAVIALIYGLVDGAHEPSMESLSTLVVPGDRQRGVQGVLTTGREVAMLVAGPAAGALIVIASSPVTAGVAAVLLLLARVLLPGATVTQGRDKDADVGSLALWKASLQGWRSAISLPRIPLMLSTFALANAALTPPIVAGVPLPAKSNGWSAAQFGVADAGYAAGALVGGLVVAKWGDQITNGVVWAIASLIPTAIVVGTFGWISQWWLIALLSVVAGYSTGFGPSLLGGAIKEATPEPLQARIQATRIASIVAGAPLGYAALAALGELVGVAVAIAILCGVLLVSAVGCLSTIRHGAEEQLAV